MYSLNAHRLKVKKDYARLINARLKLYAIMGSPGTLTIDDWVDLCRHFDGCALCKNTTADIKFMIMPPSEGGYYTKSNILPLCEKCNSILDRYITERINILFRVYRAAYYPKMRLPIYDILIYYLRMAGEEYDKYDRACDDEVRRRHRVLIEMQERKSRSYYNLSRSI